MIFLIHSETEAGTIAANLGASEYSYYFVLKEFRPVLEEFGIVLPISDPAHEVDRIHRNAASQGVASVFLSFSPPHKTFVAAECPTIPIFAWEFDRIPSERWSDDPRDDWRSVLGQAGQAITHSAFAVTVVRQDMGDDYPIVSIPAPVWDRFAPLYHAEPSRGGKAASITLTVRGRVFDSRQIDLCPFRPQELREAGPARLPEGGERDQEQRLRLGGVIYTAVFCPNDGRKNWFDMVCGFCWAFREIEDATLILKLTHGKCDDAILAILGDLAKMGYFRCRVVIIDGFLSDQAYLDLAAVSAFTVNTSHGEGQCLPLMEYMSAGKPAVAPNHTAMADYLDAGNGFVVTSHLEPARWPHDPRQAFRTRRHRIDFESLLQAYGESYRVATTDPARYRAMAAAAHEGLRDHCSQDRLRRHIRDVMLPTIQPQPISAPVRRRSLAKSRA